MLISLLSIRSEVTSTVHKYIVNNAVDIGPRDGRTAKLVRGSLLRRCVSR